MSQRLQHVLVPESLLQGLARLQHRTRIRLADYGREAVADLLARYASGKREVPLPTPSPGGNTRQLVFRLELAQHCALRELAKRTRLSLSTLVREAMDDLLAKYRLHGDMDTPRQDAT